MFAYVGMAFLAIFLLFGAKGCDKSEDACRKDGDSDGFIAMSDECPEGNDCDDVDSDINPGAEEVCDEVDNDCDGLKDERTGTAWYEDMDGDSFGSNPSMEIVCDGPEGYVSQGGDCDDTNPDLTTDCDAVDVDEDGYDVSIDCDDTDPTVHPDAAEYCDGRDNDCDGDLDEDAVDQTIWYTDIDGDGYGVGEMHACDLPPDAASQGGDCEDLDGTIYPGAPETCTDVEDKNCDGAFGAVDNDSDGHLACEECDDSNVSNFPGADEYCDGEDNNCDGTVDGDGEVLDPNVYYSDLDGDGYGDSAEEISSCTRPSGYVTDASDCDDTEATVNPGEDEICNDIDDDCNGSVDDAAVDASTFYLDADGDGYGSTTSTEACDQPTGYVTNKTDCNDSAASVNPGGTEVCDSLDNDCDSSVDEGVKITFYADADSDGYGNASVSTAACSAPTGYVTNATDCNDSASTVNPGAAEICDSADNDCDGKTDDADSSVTDQDTYYVDADGDSYGASSPTKKSCESVTGYVLTDGDCDDTNNKVNPGRDESCNGADDDCDGSADEGAPGSTSFYADSDEDGYGDPGTEIIQCSTTPPTGYVSDNSDCDDTSDVVYAGADEYNTVRDEDCDGQPFTSSSFTLPDGKTATIVTDSQNLLGDESATFRTSSGGSTTGDWDVTSATGTLSDIGPYSATWTSWSSLGDTTYYAAALLETDISTSTARCIGVRDVTTTVGKTYAVALTTRNPSGRTNEFCLYVEGVSKGCLSLAAGTLESFKGMGSFTATSTLTDIELCSTNLRGDGSVTEIGAFEALVP